MIPRYGPGRFTGLWYGVAVTTGGDDCAQTIFNSRSLATCRRFARRLRRLIDEGITIDEWARSRRDGLAWWLHTIERVQ